MEGSAGQSKATRSNSMEEEPAGRALEPNGEEVEPRSAPRPLLSSELLFDIGATQTPIIYSKSYNIRFFGLQYLHPFDVGKWGKVHAVG